MDHLKEIQKLQECLDYQFQNQELIRDVLTHPSCLKKGVTSAFERCEFLGDRVLGLVIACYLYQTFPHKKEGFLAKGLAYFVRKDTLAMIAREIDLGRAIHFSKGEKKLGGAEKDRVLANALEALIGALYLESNLDNARLIVLRLWKHHLDVATPEDWEDPKSRLQEIAQAQQLGLPVYNIAEESGPAHAPLFVIEVTLSSYPPAIGEGPSKKLAEQEAAHKMLQIIEENLGENNE